METSDVEGAWRLVSAPELGPQGQVVGQPFGAEPRGMLLYTRDGHMSATLTTAEPDRELPSFYAGSFEVVERGGAVEILHRVEVGVDPAGPGTEQHRRASLDAGNLVLETDLGDGTVIRLTWERAGADPR